jgi:hypothetical protein
MGTPSPNYVSHYLFDYDLFLFHYLFNEDESRYRYHP